MGLGAGFKWHDRDRDKEKEGEKMKDKAKEPQGVERSKSRREKKKEEDILQESTHSGWTTMCEDWLCNGAGFELRSGSPTVADVSAPKPLARRATSKEPRKGPYQLLVKERLMGIYVAIYIHRDVRNLVKGAAFVLRCRERLLTAAYRNVQVRCYGWSDWRACRQQRRSRHQH